VLKPAGVLVISSPNRPIYNEAGSVENHFHVSELDRAELKALLDPAFPQQAWHAQRVVAQSALWAEGGARGETCYAMLESDEVHEARQPAPPMYFVVACAAAGAPLPLLPALSLFDDGALSLWRDYARALNRERQLAWDEARCARNRRNPPGRADSRRQCIGERERTPARRRIGALRRWRACRPSLPGSKRRTHRLASG
jgi:hypothetical protein